MTSQPERIDVPDMVTRYAVAGRSPVYPFYAETATALQTLLAEVLAWRGRKDFIGESAEVDAARATTDRLLKLTKEKP